MFPEDAYFRIEKGPSGGTFSGNPSQATPIRLLARLKKTSGKFPPGATIGVFRRKKTDDLREWQQDVTPAADGVSFDSGVSTPPHSLLVQMAGGTVLYRVAVLPPTSAGNGTQLLISESPQAAPRRAPLLLDRAAPPAVIQEGIAFLSWLLKGQEPGTRMTAILAQVVQVDQQILALRDNVRQLSFDAGPVDPRERDRVLTGLRRQIAELRRIRYRLIDEYNAVATGYHDFRPPASP